MFMLRLSDAYTEEIIENVHAPGIWPKRFLKHRSRLFALPEGKSLPPEGGEEILVVLSFFFFFFFCFSFFPS